MAKKSGPSVHSRAARRATSPGIDTDKSLKNVRPPAEPLNARPSVLAVHASAGVAKKQAAGRKGGSGRKAVPSARARRRQERGLELAEAVAGRTAVRIQKSKGQARAVQGRKRAWDEINAAVGARPGGAAAKGGNKFAELMGDDDGDEEEEEAEWVDEEGEGGAAGPPAAQRETQRKQEDEDEIL